MADFDKTLKFNFGKDKQTVEAILASVYKALKERGYDPKSQLVGYLISGDPTYITTYNGARALICRLERDEVLEEIIEMYLRYLDECHIE